MPKFQAQPTTPGTYRVKVFGNQNKYWAYPRQQDSGIELSTVNEHEKLSNTQFQWYIIPVADKSDVFTICTAYNTDVNLLRSADDLKGEVKIKSKDTKFATWRITKDANGGFSKLELEGDGTYRKVLDSRAADNNRVRFYERETAAENQRFVFQLVERQSFEQLWFQLTPEKAATQQYDIIIIGTGMGGGVVAGTLFDTNSKLGDGAKSVLVIEKGGLAFHSHCLNASRPTGFGEDRGQQNDTFFARFREDYKFNDQAQSKQWKGGPMFNLGGRSAAWGLFAPRIHDDNLASRLGNDIHRELIETWYRKAEELMDVSLPITSAIHQNLMERLNVVTSSNHCQWQWGRIASEFSPGKNFSFALGAYSPIDKLLEIAMSKDRVADGTSVEHPSWKILTNTEVRTILWNNANRATGVVVRDANGNTTNIYLKNQGGNPLVGTCIVVGAGSVGSPAILMRSGLSDDLKNKGGLHLTDHDIFANALTFQYVDPTIREKIGSMKLQSYIRLASTGKIALVNLAIDSSSFLPRQFPVTPVFTNRDFPKLIAAYILPAELNSNNTIKLDSNGEPVITAGREPPFSNTRPDVVELRNLTKKIINSIAEALKIERRGDEPSDATYFKPLELGGVAHELGTIPLSLDLTPQLLDTNLKLVLRDGVYVCDLSVFPYSPEVNPTLTLVALALRLSSAILPLPRTSSSQEHVKAMNQSGNNVKVYVSNSAAVTLTPEEEADNRANGKLLKPGESVERKRTDKKFETVSVYRLDYDHTKFLPRPDTRITKAGDLCGID